MPGNSLKLTLALLFVPVLFNNCAWQQNQVSDIAPTSEVICARLQDWGYQCVQDKLPQITKLNLLGAPWAAGDAEIVSRLPDIQNLDLGHTNLRSNELGLISTKLKNIQSLHLQGCTELAELPNSLSKLEQLRSLDISHTPLTNHDLERLPRAAIRELDLSYTEVTSIDSLTTQTKITVLRLNHLEMESLAALANFKRLRRLELDQTSIASDFMASLIQLPELRELSLQGIKWQKEYQQLLWAPRNLTQLNLAQSHNIKPADLAAMLNSKSMRHLDLSAINAGAWTAPLKARSCHLQSLKLLDNQLTDQDLDWLERCHSLQYLDLSGTQVNGKIIASLPNGIAFLNLSDTPLRSQELKNLSKLKHLKYLLLNATPIRDRDLGHLRDLKLLQQLELNDTAIGRAVFSLPDHLKKLRKLSIMGTQNSFREGQRFSKNYPKLEIQY